MPADWSRDSHRYHVRPWDFPAERCVLWQYSLPGLSCQSPLVRSRGLGGGIGRPVELSGSARVGADALIWHHACWIQLERRCCRQAPARCEPSLARSLMMELSVLTRVMSRAFVKWLSWRKSSKRRSKISPRIVVKRTDGLTIPRLILPSQSMIRDKCAAVFPRDKHGTRFARRSCLNNNQKRDDDSSWSHRALRCHARTSSQVKVPVADPARTFGGYRSE